MTKEEMTHEDAIMRLKNIDIRNALQEDYDALDMAIKALDIELLTDKEQRIFLKAMSREREVCQKVDDEYSDDSKVSEVSLVKVCDSIERKVKKIWEKQMSSSGNPNKWIPVSERLPEKDGFYLATCDGEICGEDEPISGMAEFENGKWVDDEDDYQCVLAWMPLPEPYKAESEDSE